MRRLARRMTKEVLPTGVVVWSGAQGPGRGPAAPARVAARTLRQAWCTDVATAATAAELALQVCVCQQPPTSTSWGNPSKG